MRCCGHTLAYLSRTDAGSTSSLITDRGAAVNNNLRFVPLQARQLSILPLQVLHVLADDSWRQHAIPATRMHLMGRAPLKQSPQPGYLPFKLQILGWGRGQTAAATQDASSFLLHLSHGLLLAVNAMSSFGEHSRTQMVAHRPGASSHAHVMASVTCATDALIAIDDVRNLVSMGGTTLSLQDLWIRTEGCAQF